MVWAREGPVGEDRARRELVLDAVHGQRAISPRHIFQAVISEVGPVDLIVRGAPLPPAADHRQVARAGGRKIQEKIAILPDLPGDEGRVWPSP